MKNNEKLNELFSNRTFVESIKDLDNLPAIYDAVKAEAPEVTMDELKEYLETISGLIAQGEISEEALEDVAGGKGVLGIIEAALSAVGLLADWTQTAGENKRYREMEKNQKKSKKKKR